MNGHTASEKTELPLTLPIVYRPVKSPSGGARLPDSQRPDLRSEKLRRWLVDLQPRPRVILHSTAAD